MLLFDLTQKLILKMIFVGIQVSALTLGNLSFDLIFSAKKSPNDPDPDN